MANPREGASRSNESKRRLAVWGGAGGLMVFPVVIERAASTQPSDPGDFIFLAILLVGVGATFELAARAKNKKVYGFAVGIAVAAALLQVWINLAVGIIGSEDNPANLIYAGVIAVALCGAIVARFRAAGMALAMLATAIAQLLAFIVAMIAGLSFTGPITVFFCSLWLISAWLFRRVPQLRQSNQCQGYKEARQ